MENIPNFFPVNIKKLIIFDFTSFFITSLHYIIISGMKLFYKVKDWWVNIISD